MIEKISARRWFSRLRSEGRHLRHGPLSCTMILDPTLSAPQVGYALGRSFGSAVDRNRLRRRLRALVNSHAAEMPVGVYVFGASPKANGATSATLEEALTGLIRRAKGLTRVSS